METKFSQNFAYWVLLLYKNIGFGYYKHKECIYPYWMRVSPLKKNSMNKILKKIWTKCWTYNYKLVFRNYMYCMMMKRKQKLFKSGVVYKIECSRCNSCYVGQTSWHLQANFKQNLSSGPVQQHFEGSDMDLSEEHISIIGTTSKREITLLTLQRQSG